MFCVTCYMRIREYIHNLQQRPVRERERIAIGATAVGFAIILVIWLVSFREMNREMEPQVDEMTTGIDDLKMNFQEGKDSIQDMMEQFPSQTGTGGMENTAPNGGNFNAQNNSAIPNVDNDTQGVQNNPTVPPLP